MLDGSNRASVDISRVSQGHVDGSGDQVMSNSLDSLDTVIDADLEMSVRNDV